MDRFEKIKNYKQNIDNAAEQKRLAEEQEFIELEVKIHNLKPRIDELINLGNCCLDNGIRIECDSHYSISWKDSDGNSKSRFGGFTTNGWSHEVGLLYQPNRGIRRIREMGIIMGGACGNRDFHTDGENCYSTEWYEVENIGSPILNHMRSFVDGFDKFERDFKEYIDYITR